MAAREDVRKYTNQIFSKEDPRNDFFWAQYNNAVNRGIGERVNLTDRFNQFADTGGFSPQDLANIRARAIAPTRAVYANANREVDRQRALQGGYSPGFGVLKARMAREQGQTMADASTNTEAMIAELLQRGKLAGITGGANLYGTAPAEAGMFGNQALASSGLMNDILRSRIMGEQLPGKWDSFFGKVGDVLGIAGKAGDILTPWF